MADSLTTGNKSTLIEITKYFDSTRIIPLGGYENIQTTLGDFAKEAVQKNSLFLDDEIKIDYNIRQDQFLKFLDSNKSKIVWSNTSNAFLITPLMQRNSIIKFREISKRRINELNSKLNEMLLSKWSKYYKIDSLVSAKDPLVLFQIASAMYRERNWTLKNNFYKADDLLDLLNLLVSADFGIINSNKYASNYHDGSLVWDLKNDYYHDYKLQLLIYFTKNYSKFKWDEIRCVFVNSAQKIVPLTKEDYLFEALNDKSIEKSMSAFIELTECDPGKVAARADEHDFMDFDFNDYLPIFPYSFLKALSKLTLYYRQNSIRYKGSNSLLQKIDSLKQELSFKTRYKIENEIIKNSTFEEITSLEYWTIIFENNYYLSTSTERIIDIYYSEHWNEIINNNKYLQIYLKKSILYNDLGIIGTCRNFNIKFVTPDHKYFHYLQNMKTNDKDIEDEIRKIIQINDSLEKVSKIVNFPLESNYDDTASNLKEQLYNLIQTTKSNDKDNRAINELLSRINYEQIAIALESIKNYIYGNYSRKYDFLNEDFGFFNIGDLNDSAAYAKFLSNYRNMSEYDLYSFYLDLAGIDYKNPDGTLDFDKIYDLIKYDEAVPFLGSGWQFYSEVYSLIKLLELKFRTTIGFPRKLCNSQNSYSCNSQKRSLAWMKYMADNKLLKREHNEPVSFHFLRY